MANEDCIFCKIVQKKIPATIVHEDDESIAFMDINPFNKGHVLVIPKIHYPRTVDIPKDELKSIISKVQDITMAMNDGLGNNSYNWLVIGDEVPHAHIHIIPRESGDGAISFKHKKYSDFEEMAKYAEKIKNNL